MPSVGRENRAPMWVCRELDTREGRLMQLSPTPHQRVSLLRLCRAHEERRRRDLHFLKLCAWLLQRLGHNAWISTGSGLDFEGVQLMISHEDVRHTHATVNAPATVLCMNVVCTYVTHPPLFARTSHTRPVYLL